MRHSLRGEEPREKMKMTDFDAIASMWRGRKCLKMILELCCRGLIYWVFFKRIIPRIKTMKLYLAPLAVVTLTMTSCMDQYNPRPYWKQFTSERETTSQKQAKLTEKGDVPPRETANTAAQDPASAKYQSLCASCHGADGKADSGAAAAMNPKPRNFHDKAWQGKVTDEHIANVIKNGGAAAGLSATMPPWGSVVSDEDIKGLVAKIRAWGQ